MSGAGLPARVEIGLPSRLPAGWKERVWFGKVAWTNWYGPLHNFRRASPIIQIRLISSTPHALHHSVPVATVPKSTIPSSNILDEGMLDLGTANLGTVGDGMRIWEQWI